MTIKKEIALRDFKPWAGAVPVFNRLTDEELDTLDGLLTNDPLKDAYDETDINDMFWFDNEWICEILEINFNEFWKREA